MPIRVLQSGTLQTSAIPPWPDVAFTPHEEGDENTPGDREVILDFGSGFIGRGALAQLLRNVASYVESGTFPGDTVEVPMPGEEPEPAPAKAATKAKPAA